MTIWIDEGVIRTNIISIFDTDGEITNVNLEGDRYSVEVTFSGGVSVTEGELSELERFLGALRTTDPELSITPQEDSLVITFKADDVAFDWNES